MNISPVILQSTIPLLIGLGLVGLAGVSAIGKQRQTIRVRVRKRHR